MPAFVSTHSLPLREHYLSIRLAPKQGGGVLHFGPAFFLSVPFPRYILYLTCFQGNCRYRVGVQKLLESSQCSPSLPLSLYFCVSFFLAFPATPGCKERGGEWCHSRYEERLAPLSLAPNAGVIQISSVGAAQLSSCPVNPLRAADSNTKADTSVG